MIPFLVNHEGVPVESNNIHKLTPEVFTAETTMEELIKTAQEEAQKASTSGRNRQNNL
jgi:hypothetical protein